MFIKGQKHSEETRNKMSVSRKGRRLSSDSIAKIVATKKAKIPFFKAGFVVDENGCWLWQGNVKNGYGTLIDGGKWFLAHRFFYKKLVGKVPREKDLDHLCRNTICINPAHLEPVDHKENVRRGKLAKLDWEKVKEIRRLYALGVTQGQLVKQFGVGQSQISAILLYKCWF